VTTSGTPGRTFSTTSASLGDVVVVRDHDDGVDLVVQRPAKGTVMRVAKVGDVRARRVQGALRDLGQLVMPDDEDVPCSRALS